MTSKDSSRGPVEKFFDLVIKITIMMIAAGIAYFVSKLDKIEERLQKIEISQTALSMKNTDNLEHLDTILDSKLTTININISKIDANLVNLQTTQVRTWNKVLELDNRLRIVEDDIATLKQTIQRRPLQ